MKIALIGMRGVPGRYGGFETCAEHVGSRMVARGHEVTAFCRSQHYPERPATVQGMQAVYLPALSGKHLETLSHTAAAAFLARRHDAVICFGVGNAPVAWILGARSGSRVVLNVDGADWQRPKWGRLAAAYLRLAEGVAVRIRGDLVADARAVQAFYARRFRRATVFIPYGAQPPTDTGTEALDRFGLKPAKYILFVGRLEPENAAHDFISGAAAAGLDVPLVVVGDATYPGDYVRKLRASAPPEVVFTGYQFGAAYQQLTANAGAFVLAATVGGTHPVLLEQMAAGRCVIARDTESNREVLGDTGVLWNSTAELTNALQRLWPDERARQRYGDAARARQQEYYDWDVVTERYLELCEAS